MEKTQKEIDKVIDQLRKTSNDPEMLMACNTFTFCTKCKDWWPCECPESLVWAECNFEGE